MSLQVIKNNVDELPPKIRQAIRDSLLRVTRDFHETVQGHTPVKSGKLQRSWRINKISDLTYKVSTDVSYAPFVNDGTGIYGPKRQPIRPKRAKFLVFRINGKLIFAKQVKGIKPQKFVEKSKREVEERKPRYVIMSLRKVGLL